MHGLLLGVLGLLIAKWMAQLGLEWLNCRHVRDHAGALPSVFRGWMDEATYRKSTDYTLAKSRFHSLSLTWDALILVLVLFSGVLPWLQAQFADQLGESVWSQGAFVFAVIWLVSIIDLPFSYYEQFHLEERFGFNKMTPRLWASDQLKGVLLLLALFYPLLVVLLKMPVWMGTLWWLWAWLVVLGFQLLLTVLAPIFILPLFNRFTPLPEGTLRDRLLELGKRAGFPARNIQVMDGSRRSAHSNAFFTGIGRFRKIVLFDTLIQQLTEPELEAVLAHEIGHYKLRHVIKGMFLSACSLLAGFALLGWLAEQAWFTGVFGLEGGLAPTLLLAGLLGNVFFFWFSPLGFWLSRRHEYQADAFARRLTQQAGWLIGALRKLTEKNLSNLTPHPVYSGFYYSHPTLLEREQALSKGA